MDFEQILTEAEAELAAGVTQGTAAWRQERAGRFTGSKMHLLYPPLKQVKGEGWLPQPDAPFGVSADKYILQKAAELELGRAMDEMASGKEIAHGLATEAEALEAAAEVIYDRCCLKGIERPGFLFWGDYAGASPDGIYDGLAVVEIKCPYSELVHTRHRLITNSASLKKISPEYWCQVQTEMHAAGASRAFFVSYYKTPRAWQRNPYTGEMEHLPIGPERTHLHVATITRDIDFADALLPRLALAAAKRDEYLSLLKGGAHV